MLKQSLLIPFLAISICFFSYSQEKTINISFPKTAITGEEAGFPNSNSDNQNGINVKFNYTPENPNQWQVSLMDPLVNGYDLQSNGSTQQLWYHKGTNSLHAAFTTSQQATAWSDRTITYFYSSNGGQNWSLVGNVPPPPPAGARAGFSAIYGLSNGAAVITSHHNLGGGSTRTQLHIDQGPGLNQFVAVDPGLTPNQLAPIWPRLVVGNDDNIAFVSSVSGGNGAWTNYLDINNVSFDGYKYYGGDQAETYSLAVSPNGKVGLAFISDIEFGNIYYKESTDGGKNWSDSVLVFERKTEISGNDTIITGGLRGVNLTYVGEEPAVVFEVARITATSYFPSWPSTISFWRPGLNNGEAFVIADSNKVPYNPNATIPDVQLPVCRPVIARSENPNYLFVAFVASSADTGSNGARYFEGWFTYSSNQGQTWSDPERFTPTTPRLDFRYPSIAPILPVNGSAITVHIVMQGDITPASNTNNAGGGVTAQFYYFTKQIQVVGVDENPGLVNKFELEQNYPNPFNPSTNIKYSIAERSNVTIKVFDMLGSEVATLINQVQDAGTHNVVFNAKGLASGMYVYTITAGNFSASKKMMLLK